MYTAETLGWLIGWLSTSIWWTEWAGGATHMLPNLLYWGHTHGHTTLVIYIYMGQISLDAYSAKNGNILFNFEALLRPLLSW